MTLSRRSFGLLAVAASLAASGVRAAEHDTEVYVLGDPSAPIEIIEYASLTCPHCARFHVETLPELMTNWIDTGKAKLVFRDFPLDQMALRGAMLARCAGPDRYFAFVNVLLKQQTQWSRAGDPMAALARIGKLGGIGSTAFQACMEDEALGNRILQTRLNGANKFEVESTPTFIIGGEKYPGALSYEEIDRLLQRLSQ